MGSAGTGAEAAPPAMDPQQSLERPRPVLRDPLEAVPQIPGNSHQKGAVGAGPGLELSQDGHEDGGARSCWGHVSSCCFPLGLGQRELIPDGTGAPTWLQLRGDRSGARPCPDSPVTEGASPGSGCPGLWDERRGTKKTEGLKGSRAADKPLVNRNIPGQPWSSQRPSDQNWGELECPHRYPWNVHTNLSRRTPMPTSLGKHPHQPPWNIHTNIPGRTSMTTSLGKNIHVILGEH